MTARPPVFQPLDKEKEIEIMAKKNYKKYLPKAGSTVAVALAMTVALSTQFNAT